LPAGQIYRAGMKVAIYPGSFDPITNGHLDVARRAATMFDRVIVAVARNAEKTPMFSVQERVALARGAVQNVKNVTVEAFDGLLVEYARRKKALVIVRGLRAVSDFEYELQLALMNRRLEPRVETIFLAPKDEYTFISSRMVKEIAKLGGDVGAFVPPAVKRAMARKFELHQ
jgi:pantetheine-phosphate adenylyltransferase